MFREFRVVLCLFDEKLLRFSLNYMRERKPMPPFTASRTIRSPLLLILSESIKQ